MGHVLLPTDARLEIPVMDSGAAKIHHTEDFFSELFAAGDPIRRSRNFFHETARWRQTLLEGGCILVLDRKAGRRGVLLTLLVNGVAEVHTRRTPRVILCRATSHTRCHVIQLRGIHFEAAQLSEIHDIFIKGRATDGIDRMLAVNRGRLTTMGLFECIQPHVTDI